MRRWHHSISLRRVPGREAAAQNLPFGFELRQRRHRPTRAAAPAAPPAPRRRWDQSSRSSRAAFRRRAFCCSIARCQSETARRHSSPFGGGPDVNAVTCDRDHALRRRQLIEPVPATPAPAASMISVSSASCSSSASRTARPRFGRHLRDRCGIERAHAFRDIRRKRPAHLHGARAALLERRVVQIRVRIRVQNLVRERRRLGRIDRHGADRALARCHPRIARRPSRSIASCRQLSMVSFTSG